MGTRVGLSTQRRVWTIIFIWAINRRRKGSSDMKRILIGIVGVVLLVACGGALPSPLALEEIPAAFEKGFKTAKEETRMVISGITKQIERRQLGPAAFQLQNMLEDRSLTKEQSSLI